MEVSVAQEQWRLETGDCLSMRLGRRLVAQPGSVEAPRRSKYFGRALQRSSSAHLTYNCFDWQH